MEETDTNNKYTYDIKIKEVNLPIKRGDVLGEIYVKLDNKLISDRDASKLNLFDLFKNSIVSIIVGNI